MVVSLIEGPDGSLGFHAYDPVKHPNGPAALAEALSVFDVAPAAKSTRRGNLLTARKTTTTLRDQLAQIARQAPPEPRMPAHAPARKDTGSTMTSVVQTAAARAGGRTQTMKSAGSTLADVIAQMRSGGPR